MGKRTGSPQVMALMQRAKSASKNKQQHQPQISISGPPQSVGMMPQPIMSNVGIHNPQQNSLSVPTGNGYESGMSHFNHLLFQNKLNQHSGHSGQAPPNSPNFKYMKKQKIQKKKGKQQKYGAIPQNDGDNNQVSAFQFSANVNANGNKYQDQVLKRIPDDKSVDLRKIKSPKKQLSVGDQLSDVTTTIYDAVSHQDDEDSDLSFTESSDMSDTPSSSEIKTNLLTNRVNSVKSHLSKSTRNKYKE